MSLKKRKLFLSSNSVYKNLTYLEHCKEDLADFLAGVSRVLFVPFAAVAEKNSLREKWDEYAEKPRRAFAEYGIEVDSIHVFSDKSEALEESEAVFIGGGNTHHLLFYLKKFDLIEALQKDMLKGKPMLGSSAGTNVFCPTICTTNDMPIIANSDFEAIGGVPFQINPHYLDPDPASKHRGETREERIGEYLKVSDRKVLGLREGSWLRIESGRILLKGLSGARLFTKSDEPKEFSPTNDGLDLTEILLS